MARGQPAQAAFPSWPVSHGAHGSERKRKTAESREIRLLQPLLSSFFLSGSSVSSQVAKPRRRLPRAARPPPGGTPVGGQGLAGGRDRRACPGVTRRPRIRVEGQACRSHDEPGQADQAVDDAGREGCLAAKEGGDKVHLKGCDSRPNVS